MRPMRRVIGIVTVARSDYGHLTPLLKEIAHDPDLKLLLFVGGGHLVERFGATVRLIEADGFKIAERVPMHEDSDAPEAVAHALGRGVSGFADALTRTRPDLLVVLGDRFEMLAAVLAALPLALPVAHLHGGEVTEAAIDEQCRHAISKLAHLHFPAAEPFARRLRQMGEEAWRVHCCGAPGLDRFGSLDYLPRPALAERLGLPLRRPAVLVTFHPPTLGGADVAAQAEELLAALARVDGTLVLTYPAADTGSHAIIERLEWFAASTPCARVARSLGDDVYAS